MRINLHAALLVAVTAFVTLGLRAAPFLIFGGKRKTPRFVLYLSGVLPYAIMGLLPAKREYPDRHSWPA